MNRIIKLKNELVSEVFSVVELDNALTQNGFYSVLDDGIIGDIKQDLNVVYVDVETGEPTIMIHFEIVDNEVEENFTLKVLGVEEL